MGHVLAIAAIECPLLNFTALAVHDLASLSMKSWWENHVDCKALLLKMRYPMVVIVAALAFSNPLGVWGKVRPIRQMYTIDPENPPFTTQFYDVSLLHFIIMRERVRSPEVLSRCQ